MDKWPEMAPNGARRIFVPTNPDLVDMLGRMEFDFVIFFGWDGGGGDPAFWISKSPDLQNPRFPGSQISRRRRRRALDELSDPNLTPPPPPHNGPRDQIRRKEPLLRPYPTF